MSSCWCKVWTPRIYECELPRDCEWRPACRQLLRDGPGAQGESHGALEELADILAEKARRGE